jgi:threonine synthase
MRRTIALVCEKCHNLVDVKSINPFMICPKCNGRLHLEYCLTDKYIRSKKFKTTSPTAWKYLYNLFPFYSDTGHDNGDTSQSIVSLNEGGTPLRMSNIGTKLNLKSLRIKDETRNPTTTFMDRGTTAEISICKWQGPTDPKYVIVGSVVGGLAVSLAAYSARAAFECQLFVQRNQGWGLSPNILYQLISYGAKINLTSKNFVLPDNYYKFNYNNTFFVEGLKTTGFEICDQLGWELPDHIIVPMGRGTHLYAIYRSILEMISLGLVKNSGNKIKKVAIHGVTLEHNLFSNTEELSYKDITAITNNNSNNNTILRSSLLDKSKQVTTIAPELAPPGPSYLEDAVSAIHNTGGSIIKVSDNDLINAVSLLASHDGIFASPAGASSIAGLLKLIESNLIEHDENVVCIVTMSEGSITDSIKNWKVLQAYSRLRHHHEYQSQELLHTLEKSKKKNINNNNNDSILLGNTKRKILLLLKEQPDYTYNLRKRLIKKYSLSLDISTLYQHLNELEKKGAILRSKAESFRGKPIRFYYNITPVGNTFI